MEVAWFTITLACLSASIHAYPEPTKWSYSLDQDHDYVAVHTSLFADSDIVINVMCGDSHIESSVNVSWTLRTTPCWEEYLGLQGIPKSQKNDLVVSYFEEPSERPSLYHYDQFNYIKTGAIEYTCREPKGGAKENKAGYRNSMVKPTKKEPPLRQVASGQEDFSPIQNSVDPMQQHLGLSMDQPVYKVSVDGVYLFIIHLESSHNFNATVSIEMKGPYGYISAADWPLLPFYEWMCLLYIIYGIIWLVMWFLQRRQMLRVQLLAGMVILLGLVEKSALFAVYFGIYQGRSIKLGPMVFTEVVSTAKGAFARILIIFVSLGLGIVKPRPRVMSYFVVVTGGLYLLLGGIEGSLRVVTPKDNPSNHALLASIPVWILDVVICVWVFINLVKTLRTLHVRRSLAQFSVYRLFTIILSIAVLTSAAFLIWSVKSHRLQSCLKDWKNLWIDDAYWHLVFSLVLLVIMILWRPKIINHWYAFTTLPDAEEDETDRISYTSEICLCWKREEIVAKETTPHFCRRS